MLLLAAKSSNILLRQSDGALFPEAKQMFVPPDVKPVVGDSGGGVAGFPQRVVGDHLQLRAGANDLCPAVIGNQVHEAAGSDEGGAEMVAEPLLPESFTRVCGKAIRCAPIVSHDEVAVHDDGRRDIT